MSHGTLTPPTPPEFGVEDGYERETNVAPLLETNDFCGTGTNGGDDGAAGLDDNRLVPLLDPRGHGLCPGWWCERCGAFCFFFTVCTASLIASAATMAVCVADTGSMVMVYSFLAPEFQILKPQTTFAYRFNHTLNDLVWSSWVRTFLALASHAASRLDNLYTPYLFVSAALLVVCGVHAGLKARYFDYGGNEVDRTQAATRAGVLGFRFSEAGELRGVAGVAGFDGFDASASASAARSSHRGGTSRNLVYSDGEVPADAPADADSRFATIRGVRIHYKDSFTFSAEDQSESVGDGGAESGFFPPDAAVVFVHGFGAGAFSWRKIAPSLATMLGVRVICLDRPGFGLSARPKRGEFSESDSPYDVLEQARIVIELCAFLGVERVLFVGHADGCLVAMRAATEAEEMTPLEDACLEKKSGSNKVRVAGLALLAADARLDAAVPAPVRLLLNTKLGEKMLRPLLRTEMGEVANRRAWFDRSKLNGETLRLYQLPLCIEGWDSALMEAARTRQKMTQRDISIALEALKDTPTLMVTGADDVVAPPTRAIAVAAELRRCALKILPRCGHLPHEESPRALLEALRPFVLETLQRGRGRASLLEEPQRLG